jgi:beta-glucoside operon transcriptional antiterminator
MQAKTGTLLRILNNNAVLADVAGNRVILLGRGLGFAKHLGDTVELGESTEVFAPSDALELRQLADFAREIPFEIFGVARKAVDRALEQNAPGSQALLLSVADHLNFALVRAREGVQVDYPLRWEIAQLYPKETRLGQETVLLANELLSPTPPIGEEESTAFAMHFVNAQFAASDLAQTVAMTHSLQQIVDIVTASFGPAATEDPTSVARFVTHLRYLFSRVASGNQIGQAPPVLLTAVREAYPEVATTSDQVRKIVESGGQRLSEAETCYLDIHLSRLWTLAESAGNNKR